MKHTYQVLAITMAMGAFTACKKESLSKEPTPQDEAINVSLTKEQYLIAKKALKDTTFDFRNFILGIKQNTANKISLDQQKKSVVYSTSDFEADDTDNSYNSGNGGYEYFEEFVSEDWDGQGWYSALIAAHMPFNKRWVQLYVDVPYKYRYSYASAPNGYGAVAKHDYAQVQVGLTGANIGEISNNTTFLDLPTQTGHFCNGSAFGTFNEERERVISQNDQSMIMSKAAANGIQIGAEIKSGFVVKYKTSAISHFSWSVDFQLLQQLTTWQQPGARNRPPVKTYVATGVNMGPQSDIE